MEYLLVRLHDGTYALTRPVAVFTEQQLIALQASAQAMLPPPESEQEGKKKQ